MVNLTADKAADQPPPRIVALDGVRGLMCLFVVFSHYFGEVPHGLRFALWGWIGVDVFFVLSGFLIGKLILEKSGHANFFTVFYVRRLCRIVPAYALMVLAVFAATTLLPRAWTGADEQFPLWSYLTFTQSAFMVMQQSVGSYWLSPTWTLALEEHFYLVAPALLVFTPRRYLALILVAIGAGAVLWRVLVFGFGAGNHMYGLALLPARADVLVCGLLAAWALKTNGDALASRMKALRIAPVLAVAACFTAALVSPVWFDMFAPLLIGAGAAAFLLSLVLGAPEARRLQSQILSFFGDQSFCIYLVHLPVLGLLHGLILHARPDIATPAQWLISLAALPICVGTGWLLHRLVEAPCTAYGSTWRWRDARGPLPSSGARLPAYQPATQQAA